MVPIIAPTTTPTITPTPNPAYEPMGVPDICPVQRRRWVSPDIEP